MAGKDLELYIHIPFCVKKCSYCDFVSFPACTSQKIDRYLEALTAEIRESASHYRDRSIVSVYIGGGTPSLLSCAQIETLTDCLNREFQIRGTYEKRKGLFFQKKIRPRVEFSIECNPGTLDKEKLKIYKALGINRLSIGLQSADNEDLKVLGRIHTFEDFVRSFELAREAGFDNINVDLMQAIPGQTLLGWKRVLALLAAWMPEHISAYSLMVEEGTLLKEKVDSGAWKLPDEETEREIYYYTREFLEKTGYRRYEISNYAKPGFACIHNIGYWKRTDYLGLGLHASSLIDNWRWKHTDHLSEYIKDPLRQEEKEQLSHKEQMEEFMILGLRMTDGVSRQKFLDLFHQDLDFTYGEVLHKLEDLQLLLSDGDNVRLTDKGVDVSNRVLSEFLL